MAILTELTLHPAFTFTAIPSTHSCPRRRRSSHLQRRAFPSSWTTSSSNQPSNEKLLIVFRECVWSHLAISRKKLYKRKKKKKKKKESKHKKMSGGCFFSTTHSFLAQTCFGLTRTKQPPLASGTAGKRLRRWLVTCRRLHGGNSPDWRTVRPLRPNTTCSLSSSLGHDDRDHLRLCAGRVGAPTPVHPSNR